MLADLQDTPALSADGLLPKGEDMRGPLFLEEGLQPFQYSVEIWFRDPEGDWPNETGETWHREGRTVWSAEPLSDEQLINKTRDEIEEDLARDPAYRSFLFAERGMPEAYTVGGLRVCEKSSSTKDPFDW